MSYSHNSIDGRLDQTQASEPLDQLRAAMRDLILIHWANLHGHKCERGTLDFPLECALPFLTGLHYVSGERSARKSYMLLTCIISPKDGEHPAEETFGLELSVRTTGSK